MKMVRGPGAVRGAAGVWCVCVCVCVFVCEGDAVGEGVSVGKAGVCVVAVGRGMVWKEKVRCVPPALRQSVFVRTLAVPVLADRASID